ncbi:MAG: UDP-4-amino-4,6-dideoxy-N-acetyl-beta-L-altrosamine transaminase, partial [Nanohaloarchaea archaeon]|nr:UDP-4-amino-4,6-dideoxy-N-acetyl-beta-L-altrosamine transaminase [Candidatus Nanohaloarchaea archaeon]
SGTAALNVAVASLDLPKGSEVITTPFTFVASSNSIVRNSLTPVFADIKKDTFNLDPSEVRKKITDRTRAIMFVDFAGQPCDISELKEIAEENDLILIEDAAHALGAEYNNKRIGSIADLTTFSFHPAKHITCGEGGMITTQSTELFEKMALLNNHGIDKNAMNRSGAGKFWEYDMKRLGNNYRITDFQAALGISQLKKIDHFLQVRQDISKRYDTALKDIKHIETPFVKKNILHARHLYTILLDDSIDRNLFFRMMRSKNIGVNVHYKPVYRHSYYTDNFAFDPEKFPVAENVFNRIITLPLFVGLSDEDFNYVIDSIKSTLAELIRR